MRTRPRLRTAALACLLLLGLAGCAGAPAPIAPDPLLKCSAAPADRGIGGTGVIALRRGEDRGIGGTGLVAQNNGDDRGIGGTGILGTVTGFGSICVNGFKVSYGAATPVSVDGTAANIDVLSQGVTVAVTTTVEGGVLFAETIDVLHAVVGPVTRPADPEGVFAVMGLPVHGVHAAGVPAATLKAGDVVAVDGLQRADGTIEATHIAAAPDAKALIRGVVGHTAATSTIGTLAVVTTETFSDGLWATATGAWSGTALIADTIRTGLEMADARNARLSIEGYIFQRADGGYAVRGLPLLEDAAHGLDQPLYERLTTGQRVQILGHTDANGALRAERVIVPQRSNPLSDNASTGNATPDEHDLQTQRGDYGTTAIRPRATSELPPTVVTRPVVRPVIRPDVIRPPSPAPRPNR